jgi:hypothetical protein
MPSGVTYKVAGGAALALNAAGQMAEIATIQGPGVTDSNDKVLYAGDGAGLHATLREGDPAEEVGPGATVSPGSYVLINDCGELLCDVRYSGSGIDDTNSRALQLRRNGTHLVIMHDGDPAPGFPTGFTLCDGFLFMGAAAMNRVGDIVGPRGIAGPGVTSDNNVVLWMWHRVLQRCVPLLRTGDEVNGRVMCKPTSVTERYSCKTGGGDGRNQSLNDRGMLAIGLSFTDGTDGLYRISPPAFGDADGTAVWMQPTSPWASRV